MSNDKQKPEPSGISNQACHVTQASCLQSPEAQASHQHPPTQPQAGQTPVTQASCLQLSAAQTPRSPLSTPTTAGVTPAPRAPANGLSRLAKRGWHSRGYLPHWDAGNRPMHVVLRLYDSLPQEILVRLDDELRNSPEIGKQRRGEIESALDRGLGNCWLKQPGVAQIVSSALAHFAGQRYHLHAWVIMPNHLHALMTPIAPATLSQIMHSWKSFTAKKANRMLERTGRFWQAESFDRVIRDDHEMQSVKIYIEANPVVAGLCQSAADWPWSSASSKPAP